MSGRVVLANKDHEVVYQDLTALVAKHASKLSSLEILAIASNMVGKILALQDQRTVTPALALEVVQKNIEKGNQQAVAELSQTKGNA